MNLLIIGKSRCGKTMLSNMICSRIAGYSKISIDNLKNSFKKVFPELDIGFSKNAGNEKFNQFLIDYFDSNIYKDNKNGIYYIIEGAGLDEQTIIDLSQKKNTRVIFLGKVSLLPQDYFYQIRQYENIYDYGGWTKRLDDETLLNWCTDWIKKGKEYKSFAEKNGFEFYDTSFEQVEVLNKIVESLSKNV